MPAQERGGDLLIWVPDLLPDRPQGLASSEDVAAWAEQGERRYAVRSQPTSRRRALGNLGATSILSMVVAWSNAIGCVTATIVSRPSSRSAAFAASLSPKP